MGNCCTKRTHLIFAFGTNNSFLKALLSIENKCHRKDQIIILWTGSPAYDDSTELKRNETSHNVRASSNDATTDVNEMIRYYQQNGWDLKVIILSKEHTRGISVEPRDYTFYCKDDCNNHDSELSSIFNGIIDLLCIRDPAMSYLTRTPISSRTGQPRGSYCSDIKTFATLFMYLEHPEKFEIQHRYLKIVNFEEGDLPLYFKGNNDNSIKTLKYTSNKISDFDDDFADFLMYKLPEFYERYMPENAQVMAICTDLGDPYNESCDTKSMNLVNDFDDLVAIAMVSILNGKANVYVDMPNQETQTCVHNNVKELIDVLEVTKCDLILN